jgi:transcriptional regulator GlxA family with amidase domain
MQIAVIAFDEFTDIDVFLMWDLLNRVRRPDWKVQLLGDRPSHVSRTGVRVEMQGAIELANSADVVLFASGPGARVKQRDADYLRRFALRPGPQSIGSICSGSLILAALGLLDGKRATTHPTARAELCAYPKVQVVDQALVCDGPIGTAAGCFAAVQLAGWVVEVFAGTETWQGVLREVEPIGRPLFSAAPQA